MTDYIITYALIAGFTAILGMMFCGCEDPFDNGEMQAAFVALSSLLWPLTALVLAVLICYGLWLGARGLARGVAQLWRLAFPRKVKLPRAVARPGRVGVVVSNAVARGDIIVVASDGTYQGRKS